MTDLVEPARGGVLVVDDDASLAEMLLVLATVLRTHRLVPEPTEPTCSLHAMPTPTRLVMRVEARAE